MNIVAEREPAEFRIVPTSPRFPDQGHTIKYRKPSGRWGIYCSGFESAQAAQDYLTANAAYARQKGGGA